MKATRGMGNVAVVSEQARLSSESGKHAGVAGGEVGEIAAAFLVEWGRIPQPRRPISRGLNACADVGGVDEALRVKTRGDYVVGKAEFGLEMGEAGDGGLEIGETEEGGFFQVLGEGYAVEASQRLATRRGLRAG